jgi:predicted CxxxxCH...CXXCH cytochrome family protein
MTHTPAVYQWNAAKGTGVAHPIPFLSTDLSTGGNPHQTVNLAQFNGDCSTCHDEAGSSAKGGPVCTVCHTLGPPVATGMTAGTCLSCHVGTSFTTQGPTGNAWPNLKGSHPKHLALATFTRATPALPTGLASAAFPRCQACHFKSLPGDTANTHYSNANKRAASPITSGPASVAIHATFNAQSGTAGFVSSASAFTCSNVSCHGGQVTPGWQTGTLTVNANTWCITCHKMASTATQYNDATGRHASKHNGMSCDHCHDMTQAKAGAQNHFKYLDTTVVSGVSGTPSDQYPSDTIKFGTTVTSPPSGALTYTVSATTQGKGGCALSCHGKTHTTSGFTWN